MSRIHAAVVATLLLTTAAAVRGQTIYNWTGTVSTDWNTAGNWDLGVPTYDGEDTTVVNFTGARLGTVNISNSATTQANILNFSNPTGNYTLTSSAGQALNLPTNPGSVNDAVPFANSTINVATAGTDTINLAGVAAGSLLYSYALNINNNSTGTGSLVIGPNTVLGCTATLVTDVDGNPYQGTGAISVGGVGNTVISGSFSSSHPVLGLVENGPGTLTFSGSGVNLTGGLTVAGGTLILDYSMNPASKLGGGTLTLAGGVLGVKANASVSAAQSISGGTFVTAGQTDIQAVASTGTVSLSLGAITRNAGATIDVAGSTGSPNFSVISSAPNTNGLLGSGPAFATFSGGSTWAMVNASSFVSGFGNYGADTYTPGTNVDVTMSATQSNVTANSLRFNTGNPTLTLSGANTLQSGGILVTPSAAGGTISGGALNATGSGDLIVHQYSGGSFTINSALTSTAGLTKTGPGTLSLGGVNTGLTGPINVNRGNLTVTNLAAVSSASAINFNDSRIGNALQTLTVDLGNNTNGTIVIPITVSALGATGAGTVISTGNSLNSRVTLPNFFSAAGRTTPLQFTGDPSDTSGVNLAGFYFTSATGIYTGVAGSITLSHGYLGFSGTTQHPVSFANPLFLNVNDANAGGLDFLTTPATYNGSISIGGTTRFVVDGANTANVEGTVTSTGSGSGFQFVKAGNGSLVFTSDGSGETGGLTLSGGTLQLEYGLAPPSRLGGGMLTLDGGLLLMTNVVGGTATQSINAPTVLAIGHTDVQRSGPGSVTLALATISRSSGATMDISTISGATFTVTTTAGTFNGLLGAGPAFATFGGGATWATLSGATIVGLTTYGTNSFSSGTNTDVTTSGSPATFTTNSLRFNTGNLTLTLSGTNTLQSGGILVTPSATGGTITGGTLTAANSGDLIVHQYSSGTFTISSALSSTAGLTKTGPGTLILSGNNTGLTGPININRGNLTVTNLAAFASASQLNFNDDRAGATVGTGLQQFTVDLGNGVNSTINLPIRLSAFNAGDYGTYFSTGGSTGSTITLNGVIATNLGLISSLRFTGDASNSSEFDLTNTNTFTGNVSLLHGSLGITAGAILGNVNNALALEVNSTAAGGLVFLNSGISVAQPVVVNAPTRIVSNGTDSNTISGLISGTAGIYKDGTGTLALTNSGNAVTGGVIVNAGTLTLGTIGFLPAGQAVTVNAGAVFSPATAANNSFGTITLNGGTVRVPSGTGQQYSLAQIVTNSAGGTIDFTGAGADQLLLTGAAGIAVNGNSTWLSPANGTTIVNSAGATAPIAVAAGVTFTNGIALATNSAFGFQVTGGGTLFQNSDATNALGITAPITVLQSIFRVTDASSNGGVGNLGTGTFTLSGGTLDYGGATATTAKAITSSGGTIQVESAAATLTANGVIIGPGGLTKIGPGTLVLGNSGNTFTSLTITAGTVQVAADAMLGTAAGPVTIGPFGTLAYTGSTSSARTFTMNSGTLSIAPGQTLTLNGAAVGGGFMRGPGTFAVTGGSALNGVTTSASTVINKTGAGSFVNFSNGGALTIAAGLATPSSFTVLTNQGSGSIAVGAGSTVNAADFETYGMLTLTPNTTAAPTILTNTGTSPLFFNGGSQTFLGTPATADPTGQNILDYVDLHGNNAIVAGGLFVNNGGVFDTVGAGTGTIIAEFGALVKGAGFYQNTVKTQNGGKFQTGNSPGSASFGNFVFGPGGVSNYIFAIDDATGMAGPSPNASGLVSGWGLIKAVQVSLGAATTSGSFTWTATPTNPLTVAIDTLVNPTTVGTDVTGPMADFDPTQAYSWTAARWLGTYSGPTDAATLNADTSFDTSGIVNPIAGTFGWSLDPSDQTLSLIYTPSAVPEPGTLALVGVATVAGWVSRRRLKNCLVFLSHPSR